MMLLVVFPKNAQSWHRLTTDATFRQGAEGPKAAIGAVLRKPGGPLLGHVSRAVEAVGDHNHGEYEALVAGLELARAKGVRGVMAFTDSAVVVGQVSWDWQASGELKRLRDIARRLLDEVEGRLNWIPREQNTEADLLAEIACEEPEGSSDTK